MISLIHRWVFGTQSVFKPLNLPGYGVIECPQCHKYLRTGFALSLMAHLETDHKMPEDAVIETAVHMLDLVYEQRMKNKR